MDLDTTRAALALFEAGERFALVSTLETKGSSPRHSGAAMLVKADGSIVGRSAAEPWRPGPSGPPWKCSRRGRPGSWTSSSPTPIRPAWG